MLPSNVLELRFRVDAEVGQPPQLQGDLLFHSQHLLWCEVIDVFGESSPSMAVGERRLHVFRFFG